jgi:oxygen-dependent protoporphyrinogen oxidase
MSKHVAIVGGGIAGLAAAYVLQENARKAGASVGCTLIEASPRCGGKIQTHHVGPLTIEAGPDSFLSQKPAGVALCEELGLGDQLVNTRTTTDKAFVFSRGRLRALPEGLVVVVPTKLGPFLRSGLLSWPGMARMALDFVLPARRDAGDESLASFFGRRLGREACERLIEPLLAGIYAGEASELSIQATFPRFQEIEREHGSLLRGLLAGRRPAPGGASARTPFVTLRDGLGTLVDRLVERITKGGGTLITGRSAVWLGVRSGRPGAWTYDLKLDDGAALSADAVILAAPAFAVADLVRTLSPIAAELLAGIRYATTATVSLAYRAADVGAGVRGYGFVVPRVERRTLVAATWSSIKWPDRAPADTVLARCYLGGVGRDDVLSTSDRAIVGRVRDDLRIIAGITAEPTYAEINRWDRAMPQYAVGHLSRLAQIEDALHRYPGVLLAGAAYRGVGVPDCIRDGASAAERALAVLSRD